MYKANTKCHSVRGQRSAYSGELLFETNNVVHVINGRTIH